MLGFLEINFHVNNIYVHEIALHPEHDSEDFRPPFFITATNPKVKISLGPAYVHAITECVTSAQTVIKVFLGMHVETIRALPALLYVRIIYSSIILIKLDVSANSPDSEIGKVLDRDSLLTRAYIEKTLVQVKRVAGNDNKNILAAKFCMILGKLVLWHRQIMQLGANKEQQPSLVPIKSFPTPYKPDQIPSDPIHFQGQETGLTFPGSMAKAMAAPSMPHPDSSFTSSFLYAPQYPTPGHSPFSAPAVPPAITTAPEIPNLSATYNEGTPQSTDYSSPEIMDQPGQQYTLPMDIDPSMFNQLQGADPFTYDQDSNEWMFEGMDYASMANVPDFDWDSIPGPQ